MNKHRYISILSLAVLLISCSPVALAKEEQNVHLLSSEKLLNDFSEHKNDIKLDSDNLLKAEDTTDSESKNTNEEISTGDEATENDSEALIEADAKPEGSTNDKVKSEPEAQAELIQGIWGTAPYFFDKTTGALTIVSGTLGERASSPWNASDSGIEASEIRSITLAGDIVFTGDCSYQFTTLSSINRGLKNLTEFTIDSGANLDMSNVFNLGSMFQGNSSLETLDLSKFVLTNTEVYRFNRMFEGMTSLKRLNISGFDTSNVDDPADLSDMFGGTSLNRLVLSSNFRFSEFTNLEAPFFLNGKQGDKWIREDGKSGAYTPADFMQNYGTGDLTSGVYVAAKKYVIGANNFTMYASEVDLGSPQKLESLIRERSSLSGLDFETDADETENIKIKTHNIQAQKGTYEVTFSLYDETKTIQVNVMDDSELIDVQVPMSTEFAVLDVDDGKVISPLYKIINNASTEVLVNVSKITVTSNSSGMQLLKSTDADPTNIENAVKLRLDYSDFNSQTSVDMVGSNQIQPVLKLNALDQGVFSISGKYFGDYGDKKNLKLNIEYLFQPLISN